MPLGPWGGFSCLIYSFIILSWSDKEEGKSGKEPWFWNSCRLMFYLSDIPCAKLLDAFLLISDVVLKQLLQDIKIKYNVPYYSWFLQVNNNTPISSFTDLKVPTYLKDGYLKLSFSYLFYLRYRRTSIWNCYVCFSLFVSLKAKICFCAVDGDASFCIKDF